jgi:hypothetical protein
MRWWNYMGDIGKARAKINRQGQNQPIPGKILRINN